MYIYIYKYIYTYIYIYICMILERENFLSKRFRWTTEPRGNNFKVGYRVTSLIRNTPILGPYSRTIPQV